MGYGSAPECNGDAARGRVEKFGLYGLIRIAIPFCPEVAQSHLQLIAWLALGNVLYVGWVAMKQKNLNLLIGNSSVAHMGIIFLGVASLNLIGITGAVIIMVAHGFLAALTFGLRRLHLQPNWHARDERTRWPRQETAFHRRGVRDGRDGGLRFAVS